MSHDHRPTDPYEATRIKNAGGWVEKGRVNSDLSVSRGFGDFNYKKNKYEKKENQMVIAFPEVRKVSRKDVDFIFMGCDGVW